MENFIVNTTDIPKSPHPFYPIEANIVGYLVNEASVPHLLGTFAAGCIVILGMTLALVRGHNPSLSSGDKATILWFVLCKLGMSPRRTCLSD